MNSEQYMNSIVSTGMMWAGMTPICQAACQRAHLTVFVDMWNSNSFDSGC